MITIHTTLPNLEVAQRLAQSLVKARCVACAQIEPITSYYEWQGEIQHEQEFRLTLKSTSANYATVEAIIIQQHPYDLPAIYAQPVSHAHEPYAQWVIQQTSKTSI